MRRKAGAMSKQEAVFAGKMAVTGDRHYAAREAGYAHAPQAAAKLMQREPVLAEIARQQTETLFRDALPAAVQCLVSLIRSDKAPAGARVQAAKVVLDRTLGAEGATSIKEPHEMTPEEIAKAIDALEREAAARAKPVELAQAEPSIFG